MHTEVSVLWSRHEGVDCPRAPAPEGQGWTVSVLSPREKGEVFSCMEFGRC